MSRKKIKRKSDNKQYHKKNQNEPQDIESHKWLAKAELFRLRDYKFPWENKANTINRNNNKIFGDFNIKVLDYKPPHDIATRDDLEKLNRKIEFRIKNYSLDSLLLMIHDTYLSERSFPFVAGMMTKYALLNCEVEIGYSIYDEKDVSILRKNSLNSKK